MMVLVNLDTDVTHDKWSQIWAQDHVHFVICLVQSTDYICIQFFWFYCGSQLDYMEILKLK